MCHEARGRRLPEDVDGHAEDDDPNPTRHAARERARREVEPQPHQKDARSSGDREEEHRPRLSLLPMFYSGLSSSGTGKGRRRRGQGDCPDVPAGKSSGERSSLELQWES